MITNQKLVDQAYKDLGIKYEVEDCARFVRKCLERAGGGSVRYSGASDMFRTAGTAYAISKADWKGLVPGELLYTYDQSTGKAEHMGIYVGDGKYIHSSYTRGGVVEGDSMAQWTHAMRWDKVSYTDSSDPGGDTNAGTSEYAVVLQPVRLRKTTDTSSSKNVIRQLGIGDQLTVLAVTTKGKEVWAHLEQTVGKVTHRGWACVEDGQTRYISLPGVATAVPEVPVDEPVESLPIDREALRREFEANTARNLSIFKILYD